MADIPEDAHLIDNPVSAAPGFQLENVYVMAGVPSIMQAMFEGLKDQLKVGRSEHVSPSNVPLARGQSRQLWAVPQRRSWRICWKLSMVQAWPIWDGRCFDRT